MPDEIIKFIFTKKEYLPPVYHSMKGVYKFDEKRGWRVLQRLCFWILEKIGAHYIEIQKPLQLKKVTINIPSFWARLELQIQHLQGYYKRRPSVILMGSEDLQKICGGNQIEDPIGIHIRHEFQGSGSMMGIPVKIIPWMRGVLVVSSLREIEDVFTCGKYYDF